MKWVQSPLKGRLELASYPGLPSNLLVLACENTSSNVTFDQRGCEGVIGVSAHILI